MPNISSLTTQSILYRDPVNGSISYGDLPPSTAKPQGAFGWTGNIVSSGTIQNDVVYVQGTLVSNIPTVGFTTFVSNKMVYSNVLTRIFSVNYTVKLTATSNDYTMNFILVKNDTGDTNPNTSGYVAGSKSTYTAHSQVNYSQTVSGNCLVSLSLNDSLRLFAVNTENNNPFTIEDYSIIIAEI